MGTAAAMYCRKCSYDLRGLPANRCPECGQAFDPENPRTFRRKPRKALWVWARRAAYLLLAVALIYGGMVGWLWWEWKSEQEAIAAIRTAHPQVSIYFQQWTPPLISRSLPRRWRFLLARADNLAVVRNFSDAQWAALARLGHLRVLSVDAANLSDDGLAPLGRVKSLQFLNIFDLRIRGPGLAHLKGLRRLEGLSLQGRTADSEFDGRSLTHLSALGKLRSLHLVRLAVRDERAAALASLTGLRVLAINDLRISEEALCHLSAMSQLEKLYFYGADLTDRGMEHLVQLASLRSLWLSSRHLHLSETGIAHCQRLKTLREVRIEGQVHDGWPLPAQLQRSLPQATVYINSKPLAPQPASAPAATAPAGEDSGDR